ncbi:MAG: hypothetical protein ACON41_02325 [Parvibaculales bacterium]
MSEMMSSSNNNKNIDTRFHAPPSKSEARKVRSDTPPATSDDDEVMEAACEGMRKYRNTLRDLAK